MLNQLSNFQQRAITGLLGGALVLFLLFNSIFTFGFLIIFLAACSVWEFYGLIAEFKPNKIGGTIVVILFLLLTFLTFLFSELTYLYWIFLLVPIMEAIYQLHTEHKLPFRNVAFTLLGILYIMTPFYCWTLFANFNNTFNPLLAFSGLAMIWTSDIGAYVCGKSFGRNKLFLRVSPGKSWEGAIGGFILTIGCGFGFSFLVPEIATIHWLILGGLTSIVGIYGDLVESALKRSLGIKDSGSILPGHGGFLDRFDALFFAAPIWFVYIKLFI